MLTPRKDFRRRKEKPAHPVWDGRAISTLQVLEVEGNAAVIVAAIGRERRAGRSMQHVAAVSRPAQIVIIPHPGRTRVLADTEDVVAADRQSQLLGDVV